MQHRGKILERAVRGSTYSIKVLSDKLGISRNTLYNKFKAPNLSYDFMLQVGDIIHHDFSSDLPELSTNVMLDTVIQVVELQELRESYTRLLERYNQLFQFLVNKTHQYGYDMLKKAIDLVH